jgi:phosphoribosylamine-glycine ligase
MMMVDFDLVSMVIATINQKLHSFKLKWKNGAAINVVAVSKGYPGAYEVNKAIKIKNKPTIFFAGTKNVNGKLLTNGGRVLSVTSHGKDLRSAIKNVYHDIKNVQYENMGYRKDIGS